MNLLGTIYKNEPHLAVQVRAHIAKGEDVNYVTQYCESALRVASNNGRFDVVKILLDAGADADQLEWSPTFYEVAYGDIDSIKESIETHQDLEARDFWQRTPWLLALLAGDIEKAALLLGLGANRNAVGRCGKVAMAYPIQHDNLAMLAWLIEQRIDIEAGDDYQETPLISAAEKGATGCVRLLIDAGADIYAKNHIPSRAIQVASNMDIIKMLVNEGDDINDIDEEMHAELIGAEFEGTLSVSKEYYTRGRYQRFGKSNPERAVEPFWLDMIKTGVNAYQARKNYKDDFNDKSEPVWCYSRFGRSTTLLDDGRIIEIAGEHEDYYDPDFCIYNDVTVFNPGGEIETYIYPKETFPPTDFHTATLVGDVIYIIGCLGYSDARKIGLTPVYRLNISTYGIEAVPTTGQNPGWIYQHKASLQGNAITINGGIIETGEKDGMDNKDSYILNLASFEWEKHEDLASCLWSIAQAD